MPTTVTVVVVSCNQVRWLRDALDSVSSQRRLPDEVVVIDDGSTDGSHEVIQQWAQERRPDARLILRRDNRGVGRTLNEAFAAATSDLVAPLAADDLWLPEKLAIQVPQLEQSPADVGVLYGDVELVDEDSRPLPGTFVSTYRRTGDLPEGDLFADLVEGNFLSGPSVLLRRACWERVGGFDQGIYAEDWDFWLRVARHYRFAVTPQPVARYRVVTHSHVRRGGARASVGQLDTLSKWLSTPQMSDPEVRRRFRALAVYCLRQDLPPAHRRRATRLWFRAGGWRLLLHGRGPRTDTGGGYVVWLTDALSFDEAGRAQRDEIRALAEKERVHVLVRHVRGDWPPDAAERLGVENAVDLTDMSPRDIARLVNGAVLDGAVVRTVAGR